MKTSKHYAGIATLENQTDNRNLEEKLKKPVVKTEALQPKSQGNEKVAILKTKSDVATDQLCIGWLKGSVLRYDDPFEPAIDPNEWHALKD